jgi:transposase-like protein
MNEDYPRTWMELEQRFHDETDCLAYIQAFRWPEGLRCPRCASQRTWPMKRGLWLCQDCRHQTSVLAGTVFQDTKLPLTTLREKLIKIGAKVVRHARQVIFQMAEVAIPRELFRAILERIGHLRLPTPVPG